MEKLGMPPYKSRKAAPFGAALMFIKTSEKTSEFNSGDESEYLILPL
jgi:hypothetical protein